MLVRSPPAATDPYETPTPFEELLRSNSAPD
jgi:hypothetical protein